MFPRVTIRNTVYCTAAHSKTSSNNSLFHSLSSQLSDSYNLLCSQLRMNTCFPSDLPTTRNFITYIISVCSFIQVRWINAGPIIASMENLFVWRDRAIEYRICYSMCQPGFAFMYEVPITIRRDSFPPSPTDIRWEQRFHNLFEFITFRYFLFIMAYLRTVLCFSYFNDRRNGEKWTFARLTDSFNSYASLHEQVKL